MRLAATICKRILDMKPGGMIHDMCSFHSDDVYTVDPLCALLYVLTHSQEHVNNILAE